MHYNLFRWRLLRSHYNILFQLAQLLDPAKINVNVNVKQFEHDIIKQLNCLKIYEIKDQIIINNNWEYKMGVAS